MKIRTLPNNVKILVPASPKTSSKFKEITRKARYLQKTNSSPKCLKENISGQITFSNLLQNAIYSGKTPGQKINGPAWGMVERVPRSVLYATKGHQASSS